MGIIIQTHVFFRGVGIPQTSWVKLNRFVISLLKYDITWDESPFPITKRNWADLFFNTFRRLRRLPALAISLWRKETTIAKLVNITWLANHITNIYIYIHTVYIYIYYRDMNHTHELQWFWDIYIDIVGVYERYNMI